MASQFFTTQEHCTTYKQEPCFIYKTFKWLNYMMICDQGIHTFTVPRNLVFTYHQLSVYPSIARHKMMNVVRWAVFLSTSNYIIKHIDRESNDFKDILTRWMKGCRTSKSCNSRVRKVRAYSGIHTFPYRPGLIWPGRESILNAKSQLKFSQTKPMM